jgi:hypothetical protein
MKNIMMLTWNAATQVVEMKQVVDDTIVAEGKPIKKIKIHESFSVINSALSCLIKVSVQKNTSVKDFQIIDKIISILDTGQLLDSDLNLVVMLYYNTEEGWVNISFPKNQGYLSISETAHILSLVAYQIAHHGTFDAQESIADLKNFLHEVFVDIEDDAKLSSDDAFILKT